MRLAREASRVVTALLLSLLLIGTVGPVQALAGHQHPPAPTATQTIIDRAEEAFRRGEEAQAKGLPDIARKMFDQAVDSIHQSGIDLKTNPKLETYYRQLLNRIHKHEAPPGDLHPAEEQQEVKE